MRVPSLGRVHQRIIAITDVAYPAYIVQGDERNVMIDSGLNVLGPRYLTAIEETLGDTARLDYLLLTHSHYDHVGAAGYLKRHIPTLRVAAHERTALVVHRPSALEAMNRLSANHVDLLPDASRQELDDLVLRPFDVELVLGHEDTLDLGGLTCRAYETPGHTRDSLSFYFPEIRTLFPGDACGAFHNAAGNELQVEFVASYQDYVDSMRFLATLAPLTICMAHQWVIRGDDAQAFIAWSLEETARYRRLIERYLDAAGGDVEATTDALMHDEYDARGDVTQHRDAYLANLSAQVKHIQGLRS